MYSEWGEIMIIKMKPKISLDELLLRIEYAEHEEIDPIIDALQRRYQRLFPDWEVAFLSMPTGNAENRQKQARLMIEFIEKNWLKP
jgi:hypothetical protein